MSKSRLEFERVFSSPDISPYDQITWETRTARIANAKGEVIFEQENVDVPSDWSQTATNIVANKYLHGKLGTPQREPGVRSMVSRVVDTIVESGISQGYFDQEQGSIFGAELAAIILQQRASFNSPVWFNVGCQKMSPDSKAKNWHWDDVKKDVVFGQVGYHRPQCSACFLLSVEDSMESIMDLAKTEAMLFKYGSGCGTNLSPLRSSVEGLSSGGTSSGPISFMKGFDSFAGIIKSGGVTRRAAKLNCLNVDHPDIEDFINCKRKEEAKAFALMREGYDGSTPDSEANSSIFFQNSNLSVRVSDDFMRAVETDRPWSLIKIKDRSVAKIVNARSILRQIAESAWSCGDPGLQYDTTINTCNTCPNTGPITTSNPCQPAFAPVLTPNGIRTYGEIEAGSIIWSGSEWTTVRRKIATGRKAVNVYSTRAGRFIGTEEHRISCRGNKIEVRLAETIDTSKGPIPLTCDLSIHAQTIVDGLVFGDGWFKTDKDENGNIKSSYSLLCVGENDQCYFHSSEVSKFICKDIFDAKSYRVKTTLTREETPRTFLRQVPDRFYRGESEIIRAFLRGLYSANGSISGGRVALKATSLPVILRVQEMLSSIGIRSYYTVNEPRDIKFDNGIYTCKKSYDLNISTDRKVFGSLIGFIQPYKMEALHKTFDRSEGKAKTSYEITEIQNLGEFEVFDIEVEADNHTYWTGGLLVSNCGEVLYLDNIACNLASLNLMKFLKSNGGFFLDEFRQAVQILITAQDILVDLSGYPTEEVARNSHDYRPLGLGYANLGALLLASGLPYDSDAGRDCAACVTAIMCGEAYLQSARIADAMPTLAPATKLVESWNLENTWPDRSGACPGFFMNKLPFFRVIENHLYAASSLISKSHLKLAHEAQESWRAALTMGKKFGYRNGQTSVLAPTGTISFMMDAQTTGVEPELALVKHKKLVGGGQLKMVNDLVPQALRSLGYYDERIQSIVDFIAEQGTIECAPGIKDEHLPVFDCSFKPQKGTRSIHYMGHVKMVAVVQPFLSGGVSKTSNVPADATVEDIENLYIEAWKLGLKSITVYRDGSKGAQPLVTGGGTSKDTLHQEVPSELETADLLASPPKAVRHRLPDERNSITHKYSIAGHEGYLIIGLYPNGEPGEIFVKASKEGSTISGLMDSVAIAISLGLQHGVPLKTFVDKFSHIRFEPAGFTPNPDIRLAKSPIDYIARFLETRFIKGQQQKLFGISVETPIEEIEINPDAPPCGTCGAIMVRNGSCYKCQVCGSTSGCS